MENQMPERKHPRLKKFDYSDTGSYFVTICTQGRRHLFSEITSDNDDLSISYRPKYTPYGVIAEEQLMLLNERFDFVEVDKYVIMPNHIHIIFVFKRKNEDEMRSALTDVVCAYKSLTAKACRERGLPNKIFQTSFYEHIIRSYDDYEEIVEYIANNPLNWHYDELYN